MPKEPKIKELKQSLKELGGYQLLNQDPTVESWLCDALIFKDFKKEMKGFIKSLRKENKRLKKQLEAKYKHDDSLDSFAYMTKRATLTEEPKNIIGVDFSEGTLWDKNKSLDDRIKNIFGLPKPVAEFKCAKTNKPKEGTDNYLCIINTDFGLRYQIMLWANGWITNMEVIAFTETEPGEVVSCLNKEK